MTEFNHSYLIFGLPGTGKSYFANELMKKILEQNISGNDSSQATPIEDVDENRYERVVFCESTTHDCFWGGYRPCTAKNGKITYQFIEGPFAKLLKKAINDADKNYVMIIEEINRCDAYTVFGNLFQLLDRKKSDSYSKNNEESDAGESEYGIALSEHELAFFNKQDEYVRPESTVKKILNDMLKLPKNFYILATMNNDKLTSFQLDTAFKRRFKNIYLTCDITENTPNTEYTLYGCPELDRDICNYTFCNDNFFTAEKYNNLRKKVNEKLKDYEDKVISVNFMPLHKKYDSSDEDYGIYLSEFVIGILVYIIDNVRGGESVVKKLIDEKEMDLGNDTNSKEEIYLKINEILIKCGKIKG